jgi:hypothetical protein
MVRYTASVAGGDGARPSRVRLPVSRSRRPAAPVAGPVSVSDGERLSTERVIEALLPR